MKSQRKDLVSFFRGQVELEHQIVESVHTAVKDLKNPVVISVLRGIAFDSAKHADMYKAAESVVSIAPAMSEEEHDKISNVVRWHIDAEEKLISHLNEAIGKTVNKKIKFLLRSILADERRHHQLLKKIMGIIVRGETISEDEWWEMMWREVSTHGSPGG